MAVEIYGQGYEKGAVPSTGTWTGYVVQRVTDGDKEIDMEKVNDAAGVLASILVYNRFQRIVVEALVKTGSTPATDFPKGDLCALTGLTTYWVEDVNISKEKGPWKVTATLVNYNLNKVT